MCLCPITIKSHTNHFDRFKALTYRVPCGHCEECERDNQNSWFVRNYYEWQASKMTFFYTLTYNNDNLPLVYGLPCFSKRDIQKFVDRLRKSLAKKNLHLRYFISSEYGELYKRPHYHALFYVDGFIHGFEFYKLVENAWKFGFVKYGDNIGIVNNSSGVRYVCKYVSKDFSYRVAYDKTLLSRIYTDAQRFLTWLHLRYPNHALNFNGIVLTADFFEMKLRYRWLHADMKDYYANEELREFCDKFLNKLRQRFNRCRPFHLQSTKLGCSILELPCEILKTDRVPVMTSKGVQQMKLPRYFKRKLWFDVVESENDHKLNHYELSEQGIQHYIDIIPDKIECSYDRLLNILLNARTNIFPTDLSQLNDCKLHFDDYNMFRYFIDNLDVSLRTTAIYSVVFRDRICPFNFEEIPLTMDNVESSYIDFVSACLRETDIYDYGKIYRDEYQYHELLSHTFNCHPFFQIHESVLELFEKLSIIMNSRSASQRFNNERLARKTRQFFIINS